MGNVNTTELRHWAREPSGPERFFAVKVDVAQVLDSHDPQHADTWMAPAKVLLQRLDAQGIGLFPAHSTRFNGDFTFGKDLRAGAHAA